MSTDKTRHSMISSKSCPGGLLVTLFFYLLFTVSNSQAGEEPPPNISGIWSNALLTPEDQRWRIEDLACARTGCSVAGLFEVGIPLGLSAFLFLLAWPEKDFDKQLDQLN